MDFVHFHSQIIISDSQLNGLGPSRFAGHPTKFLFVRYVLQKRDNYEYEIQIIRASFLFPGTILGGGLIVLLTVLAIISCGLFSLIFACWSFGYVFSQIFEFASMNVKMEPLAPERERTLSDNHHQFRSSSGISD